MNQFNHLCPCYTTVSYISLTLALRFDLGKYFKICIRYITYACVMPQSITSIGLPDSWRIFKRTFEEEEEEKSNRWFKILMCVFSLLLFVILKTVICFTFGFWYWYYESKLCDMSGVCPIRSMMWFIRGNWVKYQLSFSILQKHLIFLVRKNLSNHIWNCSRLNIPDLQHGIKWSLILYNLVGNGWFLIYLNRSEIGFNQIQIIQLEIVAV